MMLHYCNDCEANTYHHKGEVMAQWTEGLLTVLVCMECGAEQYLEDGRGWDKRNE